MYMESKQGYDERVARSRKVQRALLILAGLAVGGLLLWHLWGSYYDLHHRIGGATGHLLAEELTKLAGERYTDRVLATRTVEGKEVKVLESLEFRWEVEDVKTWDDTMPATAANGVDFSRNGKMRVIRCETVTRRYLSVDGAVLPDTATDRVVEYTAYEDSDPNSEAGVAVAPEPREVTYSDGQTCFEDIEGLMERAEKM